MFAKASPRSASTLCSTSPKRTREVLLQVVGGLLWLGSGRFHGPVCEMSLACSKYGLRTVWLKSLPLFTVWAMLK